VSQKKRGDRRAYRNAQKVQDNIVDIRRAGGQAGLYKLNGARKDESEKCALPQTASHGKAVEKAERNEKQNVSDHVHGKKIPEILAAHFRKPREYLKRYDIHRIPTQFGRGEAQRIYASVACERLRKYSDKEQVKEEKRTLSRKRGVLSDGQPSNAYVDQ
jgi:hypothetical protein